MSQVTYCLDGRTATPHFPGIGRYTHNLAEALIPALAKTEQLVILRNAKQTLFDTLPTRQVTTHTSNFSLKQQLEIPRAIAASGANLYHSLYYAMPYRSGVPTVLTIYDFIPLVYPEHVSPRARLLFRLMTRLAIRSTDQFIAISEATGQDLTRRFNVNPEAITVAPLAADPQFKVLTSAEIAPTQQKYRLPDKFILYLGINKPHKNLARLIEAYAMLKSDVPLVIAGAWDDRYPESKQMAEKLRLGERVRFIGRIDTSDLPALYNAATIFVFPSLYEGFGLPVIEAMACGTAVACGNQSSLPEVAGNAALQFDPSSCEAIAAAIDSVLDNKSEREEMVIRGIKQAARFSWQHCAKQTLSVYRSLV